MRAIKRRGSPVSWLALSICLLAHFSVVASTPQANVDVPTAGTPGNESLPELRFHVPFPVVSMEGLDLELLSSANASDELRVKRKLVAQQTSTAACDGADVPAFAAVQPSDRLVAVDGVAVSLQTFTEVIDQPIGTTVMLPLFKSKAEGNILTGFARVEIVRPQSVEFQTTTHERVAAIQQWQQAVAHAKQLELEREQEARERQAADENEKMEREAREQREREETYRLEMTPHEKIHAKRNDGREFRYEVQFTTRGAIGLNWDLLVEDKTIVSHVEPKLAAERVGVIAPKDQLIRLNDIDTSTMGPAQVVQAYIESTSPRRMVFLVGPSAAVAAKAAATAAVSVVEKVLNWTMAFESPAILRGWRVRLHLATWSREPRALANRTMTLVTASPITACQSLTDLGDDDRVYISYRGECSFIDKADKAIASHAKALVVVNNVKGLGRFPRKMPDVAEVGVPVTMIGKLDGELLISVLEYERAVQFHLQEEDPSVALVVEAPLTYPPKLSNAEMTFRKDPKKAARALTFWYVNSSAASHAVAEFRVLPALFGGNITAMPFRVVMAYPQETACHPQGLGVLATRSVILVKRGGCSFGMKAKAVQAVGGAGMLMINSDESLMPLMSDPKETAELTIWAASIALSNGTFIENRLAENKNLPSLVTIADSPIAVTPT